MRSRTGLLFWSVCFVWLPGCTSNGLGREEERDRQGIYIDYDIRGDEESGFITVKAQYRQGGPAGAALVLDEPAVLLLDGEMFHRGSSRMNGTWYELMLPAKEFSGRHSILFTDPGGQQYKEGFDFRIISLKEEIPPLIKRDSLVLELEGTEPGDRITILFTDTAFYSRGIERTDTVQNGRIIISPRELDQLKSGPVSAEFIREEERELKEPGTAGGRLSISYAIRRVFELAD